ncbi:hypothetical protein ACJVC5_00375 [Peredibacter sp. HCB2-198]|uniref:hypothetical protein n=1 Tax=Peredibacter sp. HCB2-198 TaxID=3383025 RepID=UPI0038B63F44
MKWWLFSLTLFASTAFAFDTPYTMRSPRGLLMGDAFTAVNDDEFTLFYNPAALARHKRDFTLNPVNPQFHGTNILNDMDRFKDFPDEPVGASKVLMDYPAHASAGIAPGFKLFNVGVTFLANESYDVLLRNRSHPMLDLDLRSDRGVMMGIGIPIGLGRLSRKNSQGSQTSLGVSAKYLERTGVRDTLALAGPVVLDSLGQDELEKVLKTLGRVKGVGFGFDAGLEHVVRRGNSQFVASLVALDITGTNFKEQSHPDNLQVADIRDQFNIGLAAGQDFKLFHYILSADVRALNEEMDFGKRLRFGAEVGVPGLSVMAGMNSGYYSYGASLDLAFMKVTAGFYDMELGSKYKQIKSRRFVLYLSLFDFSFDA